MEIGLLKNTLGGSQAYGIEIQTFYFILITIFPRPPGPVSDAIKFHQFLTGVIQVFQFGPQCFLGAQSQWWWAFFTSAAAQPCPNPSVSACLEVLVLLFMELHCTRWSSWSGCNMLSSERLCLEKLFIYGYVSEDLVSSWPFPFQAEYSGQLASTAEKNSTTIHLCEISSFSGDEEVFIISLPQCRIAVGFSKRRWGKMPLYPIEPVPPVFHLQVQLLHCLGMVCSSSFKGCCR